MTAIDHDRLFKELICTFFFAFIKLFFPELAKDIDPDSIVMLDKEIFSDIGTREKHEVDLIAKICFRDSGEEFVFHLEAQSTIPPNFDERMFTYFGGLHRKHKLPVFPVAIFSHDSPKRRVSNKYKIILRGTRVLDFCFNVIQLNRLDWRKFLGNKNPLACALMAKMKIAAKDRPFVKLECLRMLAALRLDPAREMLVSGFIDTYLRLTVEEEKIFKGLLEQIQPEERQMTTKIITSWMEEGIEKGIEKGIVKGEAKLILRLLKNHLGRLSVDDAEKIQMLPAEQIERLGDDYPRFKSEGDLANWLNNAPRKNT